MLQHSYLVEHVPFPGLGIVERRNGKSLETSDIDTCGVLLLSNSTHIGILHANHPMLSPRYQGRSLNSYFDEIQQSFGVGDPAILLGGVEGSRDLIEALELRASRMGLVIVHREIIDHRFRDATLTSEGLAQISSYDGVYHLPDGGEIIRDPRFDAYDLHQLLEQHYLERV